jgi:hypothetical protein
MENIIKCRLTVYLNIPCPAHTITSGHCCINTSKPILIKIEKSISMPIGMQGQSFDLARNPSQHRQSQGQHINHVTICFYSDHAVTLQGVNLNLEAVSQFESSALALTDLDTSTDLHPHISQKDAPSASPPTLSVS